MDKRFEKFKKIVLGSDLTDEGKLDMVTLFSRATDEEMDDILKVLSDRPGLLSQLYGNFTAKKKAMIDGDEKVWEEVLHEEEKLLNGMAQAG